MNSLGNRYCETLRNPARILIPAQLAENPAPDSLVEVSPSHGYWHILFKMTICHEKKHF